MTRKEAIDAYFMEHRAKLIDLAAFLDRLDRCRDDGGTESDFRMTAFRDALSILRDGTPDRARRVLELLSDPSADPIPSAAGMKGAHGAHKRE
jgi:hypothetical protein